MVLSKRERWIAITTLSCVGILGLDRTVVDPLLTAKNKLDSQIDAKQADLAKAQRLFSSSRRKGQVWAEMQNNGLRRKDVSETESQALNGIRDWAQDARMSLSSVKPERLEKEKAFQKITFRATGTGGMAQISRFLWRIQSADVPIRISDLQITSRKEDTDDLSLQLGLSTIYLAPESEKDKPAITPNSQEAQP